MRARTFSATRAASVSVVKPYTAGPQELCPTPNAPAAVIDSSPHAPGTPESSRLPAEEKYEPVFSSMAVIASPKDSISCSTIAGISRSCTSRQIS